jgi:nucleoside-diphosphate-sugar epimerase
VNVLVTGATCLIGRHAVELLLARGDVVTTLQRRPSGLPVRDVIGCITDQNTVSCACRGQEAVLHLAARVGATGSWTEFERTNVFGTTVVLEAARRSGVRSFVHVSSPAVAHTGRSLVGAPSDAADPWAATGHYARSKAAAEILALDASSDGMSVVAIRPHLVWGPGDTQLVGRVVDRARRGQLALVGSGAALVDTTYVDNAATALVAAVDRAPLLGGRALVVSNGEPRTVSELTARILAAAGIAASLRHVPTTVALVGGSIVERAWAAARRADEPPMTRFLAQQLGTAHWFDQRETRAALRWEPTVSLAEGFTRLTAWYAGERMPHGVQKAQAGA